MSNVSYFEVYTEGDEPFIIDMSKYGDGRSGRNLPSTLTLTLTGYRYRPGTPVSALFPPRLIVNAANSFNTAGQVIINEVGNRQTGASVCLTTRTSDSNASSVDSSADGFDFVINVDSAGGFPATINISTSDGSIDPNVIGYKMDGSPIQSNTDNSIKRLMNSALIGKTYGNLNAVSIPIGLSKSFYAPDTTSLEVQLYGPDHVATEPDYFLASHIHRLDDYALTATPVDRASLSRRTQLYIARTGATPINWTKGGIAYAIAFGGESNTWITDMLQKGAVLSFFYRVVDTSDREVIQRFDVLVGDLIPPPDRGQDANSTYYPTTLVIESVREFVSVYKLFVLPNTEVLLTPSTTTQSLITNSVVLPVKRNDKSQFGATFSMTLDY